MERLTTSEYHQVSGSFSPNGTTLAFMELHPDVGWYGNLLDLKTRRISSFLDSKTAGGAPFYLEFSPDGHWMAYMSYHSGRGEVCVRPFPGPGGEIQISSEGGVSPLWSRNGKQLFYVGGAQEDEYWVADVHTEGAFLRANRACCLSRTSSRLGDPLERGTFHPTANVS